jgi:predicted helicase
LTPRGERFQEEYMLGWSLPAIFALNGDPAPGLVTCQDAFAISWDAAEATAKIARLLATRSEEEARKLFRLCKQKQWNYSVALRELGKGTWRAALERIHYRPFDTRWTVFERHVAVHLRERVTRHMRAGPNLALAVGRAGQVINGGDNWDIAFCSRLTTEFNLYRRGGNYLFPLYLYPSPGTSRSANLAPAFCAEISRRLALRWLSDGRGDLNSTFGPEDVFAYIYALLYAPDYRTRYADFLKIDFPRIPLPRNPDLFRQLCLAGHALARAHLLEQPLSTTLAWASSPDHNLITRVSYSPHQHGGCISINPQQYLSHVPADAWTLTIGGYQVARKWLLDRQGRRLSADDLTCYRQIIASLIRTRELMTHIDALIEQYSGWPL